MLYVKIAAVSAVVALLVVILNNYGVFPPPLSKEIEVPVTPGGGA